MDSGSRSTAPQRSSICTNELHGCQIHQRESSLIQAVVAFLSTGACNGESLVVMTHPSRQQKVIEWLKAKVPDPRVLVRPGKLVVYSCEDFIKDITRDGMPVWELYAPKTEALFSAASGNGQRPVRCYADAVSELWHRGEHEAAVELEVLSNRLLKNHPTVNVFCGYLLDALSTRSYSRNLELIGRLHGRVVPGNDELELQCALDQAGREILGTGLQSMGREPDSNDWRARLPRSMRYVQELLDADSVNAERVLERARKFYSASLRHHPVSI